jgi:pimeloyl-ACP methyl ester carboxylesterase
MIFNAKLIELKTKDGLLLPGAFFEPKRKTKKVAIFLHGNGSSSIFYALNSVQELANELNAKGISYLAFNNRGAGYAVKVTKIKGAKEERVPAGTAYELIKECVYDIDAAIAFLEDLGYREFYLIGMSTGANKICVYNYYKPKNSISKCVLVSGGDDSGIYHDQLGKKAFKEILRKAKQKIKNGKGIELVPRELVPGTYSWQSIYDTLNPDGDYNTFPFNDYLNKLKLSSKPLFRHYRKIQKPILVVYGDQDEYCYGRVSQIMQLLKEQAAKPEEFSFTIIKGANHGFTGKEKDLNSSIANWLS